MPNKRNNFTEGLTSQQLQVAQDDEEQFNRAFPELSVSRIDKIREFRRDDQITMQYCDEAGLRRVKVIVIELRRPHDPSELGLMILRTNCVAKFLMNDLPLHIGYHITEEAMAEVKKNCNGMGTAYAFLREILFSKVSHAYDFTYFNLLTKLDREVSLGLYEATKQAIVAHVNSHPLDERGMRLGAVRRVELEWKQVLLNEFEVQAIAHLSDMYPSIAK